ncbi:unnamed protein product [Mesocestoides corti]|uniref:Uncharacterized protein n=1 Tax=Mesocestoides corti TaxID=53468 RepID=A0A0R3UBG2_MESCO|nr:unnamed protein product [Mesocestoides corti]
MRWCFLRFQRRLAQIPLVPTRIVRSRGHGDHPVDDLAYQPPEEEEEASSQQDDAVCSSRETTANATEVGEYTIARRLHVTDLTLPPSAVEDGCITSPPLVDLA